MRPLTLAFSQPPNRPLIVQVGEPVDAFTPEPSHTYYVHPDDPTVLIEKTRDGDDFIKLCERHQWASIPTPGMVPSCPQCIAEYDGTRGHRRYVQLHSAEVRIMLTAPER